MSTLLAYARRALTLPPAEAAARARYVCALWWSARRQRLQASAGGDPLDAASFAKRLRADSADSTPASLFRGRAVLPVAWCDAGDDVDLQMVRHAASRAIDHRFDLLGAGPVRVDYHLEAEGMLGVVHRMAPGPADAQRQRQRMQRLLPGSADGYEPIDWHVDFRSGFRWDPSLWFADIRYGTMPGVDVKVPWELSRFQHVGALGLAWRLDPHSAEGRRAPVEFRSQVIDWIAANPPGYGVNWACAMDAGIRAVNWLMGVALMDNADAVDQEFRWLLARALWTHGRHIEANLEYHQHQTGNHYLANVMALLCIGAALPEFEDADRWLLYGLQELDAEMQRQILPDGASIEGSSAYQHLVLEMFLLGACVARRLPAARRERLAVHGGCSMRHPFAPALRAARELPLDWGGDALLPERFISRLHAMTEFAAALTKQDGRIPQVGDNDSGRIWVLAPSPFAPIGGMTHPQDRRTALAVAGRLLRREDWQITGAAFTLDADLLVPHGDATSSPFADSGWTAPPTTPARSAAGLFPHAGVAVVREGPLYLIVTCGSVPANCSGGHFHNDLLSWELQWNQVDLVVDSGSFTYTPSRELRNAWRATEAHNTIRVRGLEQRSWPKPGEFLFIVEQDARIEALDLQGSACTGAVEYADVRHTRRWEWTPDSVRVSDHVETGASDVEWRLTLAPGVTVSEIGVEPSGTRVQVAAANVRAELLIAGLSGVHAAPALYSPGYGQRIDTIALVGNVTGPNVTTSIALVMAE